jgi:hypothetical protein
MDVIRCGGDTDTTAAIVGGIVGAGVGKDGIPSEWLNRLSEWPRTVRWMETLGEHLEQALKTKAPGGRAPGLFPLGVLPRNFLFFLIVLGHLFRRALPPY